MRSYTGSATTIFPLKPGDRGRRSRDVASRLPDRDYLADAQAVCDGAGVVQRAQHHPRRRADPVAAGAALPPPERRRRRGDAGAHRHHRGPGAGSASSPPSASGSTSRSGPADRGLGYTPDGGTIVLDATAGAMMGLGADAHPVAAVVARSPRATGRTSRPPSSTPPTASATSRPASGCRPSGRRRVTSRSYGRLIAGSDPRRISACRLTVSPEYALAETRDLMLREMNHRVKNLFAIIGGMISAGSRAHRRIDVFAADIARADLGAGPGALAVRPGERPGA